MKVDLSEMGIWPKWDPNWFFITWTPRKPSVRYSCQFSQLSRKSFFVDFVAFNASKCKQFLFIFWSQSLIVPFLDPFFAEKKLLGSPDLFFDFQWREKKTFFFCFFLSFFLNWWIFNLPWMILCCDDARIESLNKTS